MSSSLANVPENELFDAIFTRLEEIKKIWRSLKGSLLESLSNFEQFGKSSSKSSRTLLSSCHPSDPSSYSVLTIRLLRWKDKIAQKYIQASQSITNQLMKSFEDYSEKIESTQAALVDSATVSLKNLANFRQNYAKEKARYERICKETEALVLEKKKLTTDPLLYYNLIQQKRVRAKLWNKIKELREVENQMKDAISLVNDKQVALNATLSDTLKTFRVALKTTFKNILEAVKRYSKGLGEVIEKALGEHATLTPANQVKDLNEAEEKYIEEQARLNVTQEIGQSQNDSIDLTSEETFSELQRKLLTNPNQVQDLQILLYADELQKHYDLYVMIIEERRKLVKGLKVFMQEIAVSWDGIAKLLVRISKNPFSNINGMSVFCKRISELLEPFYGAYGGLAKKFQNFGTFITMKLAVVDTVISDQRTNLKNYQALMMRAIKDHLNCRAALENCSQMQERTQKKIVEIAENNENDPRLPKLKKELDGLMVQHVEYKAELRKHAAETAKVVIKIEQDYRKQESSKSQSFKHVVEGILGQENCLFLEMLEFMKAANSAVEPDEGVDSEIMIILGQDEKLAECLRFVDSTKGKEISLAFQKLYVPPQEFATEYEKGQLGNLGCIAPGEFIDLEDVQVTADKKGEEAEMDEVNEEEGAEKKEEEGEGEIGGASPSKLDKRFQISGNDKLLGDFTCAVLQTIPRQGWMYIYNTKVCFSSAKIFGDFVIRIPMKDIQRAEKKIISLVFDSAMSLITKYGEITFTSFFSRDKAISLIESCMKGEFDNIEENKDGKGEENQDKEGFKEKSMQRGVVTSQFEVKLNAVPMDGDTENLRNAEENKNELAGGLESQKLKKAASDKARHVEPKEENETRGRIGLERDKHHERAESKSPPKERLELPQTKLVVSKSVDKSTERKDQSNENGKEEEVASASKTRKKEHSIKHKKHEEGSSSHKEEREENQKEREKVLEEIKARRDRIEKTMVPAGSFTHTISSEVLNCSVVEAFNLLFADRACEYKGKKADTFLILTKLEIGDYDIKINKWSPVPPQSITEDDSSLEGLRSFVKSVETSNRSFSFMHPVKDHGIMFLPKACPVDEKHKVFWLSREEIVIQAEVRSSKVPLSDCFFVRNSFTLKSMEDKTKCELTWKYGIEFVKSTLFKGKIAKTSLEESVEFANKIVLPVIRFKVQELAVKKEKSRKERESAALKQKELHRAREEHKVHQHHHSGDRELVKEEERVNKEKEEEKVEKEEYGNKEGDREEKREEVSSGIEKEGIGEILKEYLKESKMTQESMREELKGIKFWMMVLAGINTLILLVLFMRR